MDRILGFFGFSRKKEENGIPDLLPKSWRPHIIWTEEFKTELRENVRNFKIGKPGVEKLNVLMIGDTGSGKTSFFNSCLTSIVNEDRIVKAFFCGGAESSVTLRLHNTNLPFDDSSIAKINLYDCRGLNTIDGLRTDDLYALIDGRIRNGYMFKVKEGISVHDEKYYNQNPSLKDKMHCILIVIHSTKTMVSCTAFKETIDSVIRKYSHSRDVPIAILLNQVDLLRGSIQNNIQDVFLSSEVRDKVREASKLFGVNSSDVLPMINYFEEQVQMREKDILALFNLRHIMRMANDYVRFVVPMEEEEERLQQEMTMPTQQEVAVPDQ